MTQSSALIETAPAKINLYLHVLGRRGDGYHLLDSLVVFAALGDELSASLAADLTLSIEGPFAGVLGQEPDNLVLRAARALDPRRGAELILDKRLPIAAGIGGGSADAAAALRLLARLWNIDDDKRLATVAPTLGADVPVCLAGHPAFIGGAGEQIDPAPKLPAAGLVLVNPGVPLKTPAVFGARTGVFAKSGRFETAPRDAAELADLLRSRTNDLAQAAISLVPTVHEILNALAASPDCLLARMSGSGATCFGLYPDAAAATRAAQWLSQRSRAWWVAPTVIAG